MKKYIIAIIITIIVIIVSYYQLSIMLKEEDKEDETALETSLIIKDSTLVVREIDTLKNSDSISVHVAK